MNLEEKEYAKEILTSEKIKEKIIMVCYICGSR